MNSDHLSTNERISQNESQPSPSTQSPETEVLDSESPAPNLPDRGARWRWWIWLLDLALFLALFAAALPVRFQYTHGDLWLDEADYAVASLHGFEANRWDRSDNPREPDSLIRARHFHAPLTAQVLELAHRWSADDRALRTPFVLAGGLTVGLIYLCGVALFDRRREIAIGCAALVICTPAHIRMASHAVPWSPIILEMVLLLWTLILYTQTRRHGWLVGAGGALGMLFVTSETFFVVLLALVALLPFLLQAEFREAAKRKRALLGLAGGAGLFLAIALALWPIGLLGHSLRMLRHYVEMRHVPFPTNIGDQVYDIAPRWAYLYWYWHEYRPFFVCYALGTLAVLILLALRKAPAGTGALLLLTGLLLAGAHKAHIIGPEYLAHCLVLLSLVAGYFVLAASRLSRPLGFVLMAVVGVSLSRWVQPRPLPGMDARAQISRWPQAARFLATRWQPKDRLILGPQPAVVARWYLSTVVRTPIYEAQIGQIPLHDPKPAFLDKLRAGKVRYVVISSAFEDRPYLDPRTRQVLEPWRIVWRSDERGTGEPRLTVYAYPRGETSAASQARP
jgi:hypothetical protein